jgi:SH3 domain-containing YSC84-like protein 1
MWKLPVFIGLMATITWAQEETPDKRLRHSTDVLQAILSAPDKGIPHHLFERAQCVMVVPSLKKGAFVFGADYGRGFAVCRSGDSWGGPAAIRMGGGSFGAQLGLESTDVVMLVMNQKGMNRLTRDKFTIGADASAAIGPVGRDFTADTDATLRAEILSYSRAKGAFAGVALDGTTITRDRAEDRKLYGRNVSTGEILRGKVGPSQAANPLLAMLNRYSRQNNAPAQQVAAATPPQTSAQTQSPSTVAQTEPAPVAESQSPSVQPQSSATQSQEALAQPGTSSPQPQSNESQGLPRTASPYPWIGLCGLLSLGSYLGLRLARRM